MISLKELSEELGVTRSSLRKFAIKNGVRFHKRRTADSGNQRALMLSVEEANYLRELRSEGSSCSVDTKLSDVGEFYVIALVPELDPRRIKLGFADNVEVRLAQHRTSAPTAVVLKAWPCRRSWERVVIDSLTSEGCHLVLNEVFDCGDVSELIDRADRLFDLLPNPDSRPPLSPASPLNT